jgi:hypothetical protein
MAHVMTLSLADSLLPAICGLALLASSPTRGAAQARSAGIVGTWHGTSTCADTVAFPACHDEEVIYDARAVGGDSVAIRADKVVNGVREFMGEYVLGRGVREEWVSELRTPQFHLQLTLVISGTSMSGALIELPSGRRIRALALQRTP